MLTWSPAIRERDHVFYRVSQVKAAMKNFRSFRDQCICYMAKNTRDDFPVSVKRVLARRVNSRCSNPTCGALTSGRTANPSSLLNIGLTAHATAAAPCGPRFDPNLTEEQNKFPENGILALPELWKPLSGEAEANLDAPTSNRRQEMVDHGSQKRWRCPRGAQRHRLELESRPKPACGLLHTDSAQRGHLKCIWAIQRIVERFECPGDRACPGRLEADAHVAACARRLRERGSAIPGA